MIDLTTKIEQMTIKDGKRILVTSDIHGHLSYLKALLKKVSFSDKDILFIVGDMIEKGPESLNTLRYVMELCKHGNVVPLIGNVDAYRLKMIYELSEENVSSFFNYMMSLRQWTGTSFYEELAAECGYTINTTEDILISKKDVITHFEKEFDFLANLPTIVETQKFIFVHGGLRKTKVSDNLNNSVMQLTKYDAFAENTQDVFDKYELNKEITVVSIGVISVAQRHSLVCLQGLVARDKPAIFFD